MQKRDYEGFLVSKFYPAELQSAYIALRAFFVRDYACFFLCIDPTRQIRLSWQWCKSQCRTL